MSRRLALPTFSRRPGVGRLISLKRVLIRDSASVPFFTGRRRTAPSLSPTGRRPAPLWPTGVAALAVALYGSAALAQTHTGDLQPAPRSMIRGMAIGQYAGIRDARLQQKIEEIKGLGATHLSIVVTWSTPDVHAVSIAPVAKKTTPDALVGHMIQQAHLAGLKVFLFPILDVQKRRMGQWRGTLTPSDWSAWWRDYRKFILHYAKLAQQHGTELFCAGSELVSTEGMRDRWIPLIRAVRGIYPGKIVYSANWDHYRPVSFWDAVDVIGLTAYHRLAHKPGAAEAQMYAAWKRLRNSLVAWARSMKRPIVFTEVGYPSMAGGAMSPWNYTLKNTPSPQEQQRAYSAFIRAWDGAPELAGVFFWNWNGQGGPQDRSYTPRGKPAEELIRRWFSIGQGVANRRQRD